MFGGGAGGGVTISPVGFVVVGQGQIKMLPVHGSSAPVDRILDMVPGIVDKINFAIANRAEKKENAKKKKEPVKVEAVFED